MFRRMRDRFSVTFRTADGHKFKGQLGDPGASPRPRKEIQNLPHRALVTDKNALAKPGDLVNHGGTEYLLAGQNVMEKVKRFLAVEVNTHMEWRRQVEEIDPVTKMSKGTSDQILDPALPVVWEPQRSVEEEDFTQSQYRIFTAADVQEGDLLNGMKVNRVSHLFGLQMVEVI